MIGRALLLGSLVSLTVTGCLHRPPYGPGGAPSSDELMLATAPQVDAVQVSSARVVLNRLARGDLGFVAQAPSRFNGGVTFKGLEMIALAFNEEGYGLRSQSDDFIPVGFYAGPPPADCVVEVLLGVPFETAGLVSLVLGGAPVLPAPYEIDAQKWSRKEGYEYIVLRNAHLIQELRFGWIGGGWRSVGGALWRNDGGKKGPLLWTVEHLDVARVGDVYLPQRTRVVSPGKRRDNIVTIIYKQRNLAPAFAQTAGDDGGEGGDDGGAGDGGGGDDGWGGDDGGWENEDGGWENQDDPAPADGEAAAPEPQPEPKPAPKPAPEPKPRRSVPAVFFLDGTGLPSRGDLCK
jgi:hypothetical protein